MLIHGQYNAQIYIFQYVRRLSATFDEMEKAKLAAEDATRRLSSSSSSNSSEVFQDDPPSIESGCNSNQDNSQNEDVEVKAVSLCEDIFELGAEGMAINYIFQIPCKQRCRYR